jgi:hypothetical protein
MRIANLRVGLAVVLASLLSRPLQAGIVSSLFDSGDEMWTVSPGSSPGSSISWSNSAGHGGAGDGGIIEHDAANNPQGFPGFDWFEAPVQFRGNQSGADFISYALKTDPVGTLQPNPRMGDVVLKSTMFGDLYFVGPNDPTSSNAYNVYVVHFDDPNWHIGSATGAAPSASLMQDVLGHLNGLEIYADWYNGEEHTYLDNVILIPEPGMLLLFGIPFTYLVIRLRETPA